jgi:hypothetical protein
MPTPGNTETAYSHRRAGLQVTARLARNNIVSQRNVLTVIRRWDRLQFPRK